VIGMTLALFGLLTRLRFTKRPLDLNAAAAQQHLFPLIGMVVGLLAAFAILVLDFVLGNQDAIVSGALLLIILYGITGILHTEGLADMADGMMAHGTAQRKREIMKDPHVGVAAVMTVFLFLVVLFALATRMCVAGDRTIDPWPYPFDIPFVLGMVVSEAAGKLSMSTCIWLGPSSHEGMGALFVRTATNLRFMLACVIAGLGCFLVVGWLSVLVSVGVLTGAVMTAMARRHFGGVSGDVFGAANEVGRVSALLLWVIVA
jgi:adenosylcobinamide-GDP ribazoletransferase